MKVGILGGGQLGRMLLQAGINYPVETHVLEKSENCPSAHLCHYFTKGDINDYETVYAFGKNLDVLTIEIEAVNTDALQQLESEGVRIIPNSKTLKTLKNKALQKQFYKENNIPTSPFVITDNQAQLKQHLSFLPAVHKLATGGYDGRGVQIITNENELHLGFDESAVLEKQINIKHEIAIIVAIGSKGEIALFPCCEMLFDPVLNLLDFQICPAKLPEKVLWKAEAIAMKVVKDFNSSGIFAVEMFVDYDDDVWLNEIAPRVHNSGHHTIEANFCSQFDMLWRVILDYPLGNTDNIMPSAIVNILGAEGQYGKPEYKGMNEVLKLDNIFVHLYGKNETKPGRKMGHVTILSFERQELIHQAMKIKNTLQVLGNQ